MRKEVAVVKKLPIYLVSFDDQHTMCSTMLRFQEFYESPHFRGKAFTREQYEDWYAATNGAYTYYEDWSGFNVPSGAFLPFRDGRMKHLTEKEKALLELFGKHQGDFYVIACINGDATTLAHEIVHGLYWIREVYADAVEDVIEKYPDLRQELHEALIEMGYHPDVVNDEINAYLLTGVPGEFAGINFRPLQRKLHQTYEAVFRTPIRGKEAKQALAQRIYHKRFVSPVRY